MYLYYTIVIYAYDYSLLMGPLRLLFRAKNLPVTIAAKLREKKVPTDRAREIRTFNESISIGSRTYFIFWERTKDRERERKGKEIKETKLKPRETCHWMTSDKKRARASAPCVGREPRVEKEAEVTWSVLFLG